jgi:F420-dependent oxidoreductase-like protein
MSGKINFAVFSAQAGANFKGLADRAQHMEKLGYHSIWLADHFWTRQMLDLDFGECLTLMTGIAARTERLRIGSLVLCNLFRNPALLGKTLSTLDQVSNGRLEAGLGAGWMDEECKATGIEFPPIGRRLRMLEETVQILKSMFTEKRTNFKGRYYTVTDLPNNPKPVQKPHPPITIAGSGEKVMLKIVAKYADKWNLPAGYKSLDGKINLLKEHCKAVGRDFNSIEVTEQLLVCIGANDGEVEQKWKMAQAFPFARTGIKGTPAQLVEQLKERVRHGITTFTIFFSDLAPPATLELFAREVMPAFA